MYFVLPSRASFRRRKSTGAWIPARANFRRRKSPADRHRYNKRSYNAWQRFARARRKSAWASNSRRNSSNRVNNVSSHNPASSQAFLAKRSAHNGRISQKQAMWRTTVRGQARTPSQGKTHHAEEQQPKTFQPDSDAPPATIAPTGIRPESWTKMATGIDSCLWCCPCCCACCCSIHLRNFSTMLDNARQCLTNARHC